jgi:hypothetical protein
VKYLRPLSSAARVKSLADRELVERFALQRDEEAFAVLVRRHGPMVLRVCQRVLHDAHAAEDAFQAVFLVLSRKAASLRRADWVGERSRSEYLRSRLDSPARNSFFRRRAPPGPHLPRILQPLRRPPAHLSAPKNSPFYRLWP